MAGMVIWFDKHRYVVRKSISDRPCFRAVCVSG